IVALILQNGQPVYSRSVGVREVGGTTLIGESDMFRLDSLATDVLGAVIEKVTGGTLGAFVTERIAKPLRIQSFVFSAPESIRSRFVQVTRPAQVTGALGTGYVPVAGPEAVPFPATKGTANLDPNRAFSPTAYNSGGAGMSGTVGDYARFLQMLLN